MTQHKVFELLDMYQEKVVAAGYDTPERTSAYSLLGTTEEKHASGRHVLWMISEAKSLFNLGKGPKGFRWVGFIQHALVDMGLFTLEEIKDHSRNADEYDFPPPPGMDTCQAKVLLNFACGHCGTVVTRLARQTWIPLGHHLSGFRFKEFDPDDRLDEIQGVGIKIGFYTRHMIWDYNDLSYNVILHGVPVHPLINDESLSLAFSLLRDNGWSWVDDEAKAWREEWAKHHWETPDDAGKDNPHCRCRHRHVLVGQAQLTDDDFDEPEEVEEPEEPPKKRKKKKKKKRNKPEDTNEGEEGSPDAGGQED